MPVLGSLPGGALSGARGVRRLIFAAALLCGLVGVGHRAEGAEASEYKVKAVFLFYFTQFVSWPPAAFADANAPFVIGVLGDDPFGGNLEGAIHGEKADGRPIEIRRFSRIEDLDLCHILFVSRSQGAELGHVLSVLRTRSILTVSDIDGFSRAGGMIRFLMENNKVRLRINVDAAKSAGLVISSKLLRPSEVISGQGD